MDRRPPQGRPGRRLNPARRARLLLHAGGLGAALLLAHLLGSGLLEVCTRADPERCGAPAGAALLLLQPAALLAGLLVTRRRRLARGVYLAGAGLAVGLLLLTRLLAPAFPTLAPAALLLLPLLSLLSLPLRAAEAELEHLGRGQRAWWSASLRAARLTRRMLGAGAYRQLCATGHIRVVSTLYPGRQYLVPRRTSPSGARVLVEEHGRVLGGLCLRPRQPLPDPEEVVAHVLLLRGDERAYLAAANFFPYDTALTPQATARRL